MKCRAVADARPEVKQELMIECESPAVALLATIVLLIPLLISGEHAGNRVSVVAKNIGSARVGWK